jgi:hypothetical protein
MEGKLLGGFSQDEIITFADRGRLLVTANGGSLRVWDLASKQLVQMMDTYGSPIVGLSWLPKFDLLVVASENSRIRLWGTSKTGETLKMQPVHIGAKMPTPEAKQPATPIQLQQMIDLRTFPRLTGDSAAASDAFRLSYTATESAQGARLFYRHHLEQAGWQEFTAKDATVGSLQFQKNGFLISASFYEAAGSNTSVRINFAGNYDLRRVPKFDAAPVETVYENADTVHYRTKADLVQIETELLRKLHQSGWTAYSRLNASHSESEDSRDLEFFRDGMLLRVAIDKYPADPAHYNIQYARLLTTKTIPVPSDSGYVEFDDATQPYLVGTTSMDLGRR